MFGTLLESRGGRRRRPGGAAVSVAVHMAIIAAVTATTVHGRVAKTEKPAQVTVHLDRPPAPPPPETHTATNIMPTGTVAPSPVPILHIDAPKVVPPTLPPMDAGLGNALDSIVVGGSGSGLSRGIVDGTEQSETNEWRGVDLQTRIVASGKARYPESLRQAGIDGVVLVRFVVDTSGRVDMSSVAVVSSTHDLFSRAVREALPGFRFKPAESGGRRVAALAEMPFEFRIAK